MHWQIARDTTAGGKVSPQDRPQVGSWVISPGVYFRLVGHAARGHRPELGIGPTQWISQSLAVPQNAWNVHVVS